MTAHDQALRQYLSAFGRVLDTTVESLAAKIAPLSDYDSELVLQTFSRDFMAERRKTAAENLIVDGDTKKIVDDVVYRCRVRRKQIITAGV